MIIRFFNRLKTIVLMVFLFVFCLSLVSCDENITKRALISEKIEISHKEIWKRFVNKHGIINDYTDLAGTIHLPTPEECKMGQPNAIGWWTPIENGPMFNGLYMDGAVLRWQNSNSLEDRDKVKILAKGLMMLASISKVDGFVPRGVSSDGMSHYAMSSHDQLGGWFYGLWRYLETDIPSKEERKSIENMMIKTAKALVKANWHIPAEPPFNFRGGFHTFDYNCVRLLFVEKVIYSITKDEYWIHLYNKSLYQTGGTNRQTRLEIASMGLPYIEKKTSTWDQSPSAACLRSLWELEKDTTIKEAYRKGLELNAANAMKSFEFAYSYPANDTSTYDIEWRKMNKFWVVQTTETEATNVAMIQLNDYNKRSKRFTIEHRHVREPIFSAWIVSLAPDQVLMKQRMPQIKRVLELYDYNKLYTAWFFPVEATWWRIKAL